MASYDDDNEDLVDHFESTDEAYAAGFAQGQEDSEEGNQHDLSACSFRNDADGSREAFERGYGDGYSHHEDILNGDSDDDDDDTDYDDYDYDD